MLICFLEEDSLLGDIGCWGWFGGREVNELIYPSLLFPFYISILLRNHMAGHSTYFEGIDYSRTSAVETFYYCTILLCSGPLNTRQWGDHLAAERVSGYPWTGHRGIFEGARGGKADLVPRKWWLILWAWARVEYRAEHFSISSNFILLLWTPRKSSYSYSTSLHNWYH